MVNFFSFKFLPIIAVMSASHASMPSSSLSRPDVAPTDLAKIGNIFQAATEHQISHLPINEIVARIGREFVGTPYEAGTLDRADEEVLVTYLQGFDCVTFMENVLALSLCVKLETPEVGCYRRMLERIRYRGGILNGYVSRLHYFSEWISDNETKKVIRNVTVESGGKPLARRVNWMTTHRDRYRQLSDSAVFGEIQSIEVRLSQQERWYIPRDQVLRENSTALQAIHHGDFLAFTSTLEGLDVAHTGIAVREGDGIVRLMHASSESKRVVVTEESLKEYLRKRSRFSGIMIARVLELPEP